MDCPLVDDTMNRWLVSMTLIVTGCSSLSPPDGPDAGSQAQDRDASVMDIGVPSPGLDAGMSDSGSIDVEPNGVCSRSTDCIATQSCSSLGICHDHECLTHLDCSEAQRCANHQCLNRVTSEEGIIFERYRPDALHDHVSLMPSLDLTRQRDIYGDFGFGAALFDFDADQDLDLFIGVQSAHLEGGSSPCIYENIALGAHPEFRATTICDQPKRDWSGGYGFDVEGDGYHELIVTGDRVVQLLRFHPTYQEIDLLALIPEDNPRRDCNAGAAVNLDLNYDGQLDLVVSCHLTDVEEQAQSILHLAFLQTQNGRFEALTREAWNQEAPLLLEAQNSTIAIGAADLNEDGLLDLMVSEDFYTGPTTIQTDPGGIYFRCGPMETCRFRPFRIGRGPQEHGGLMGSAVIYVEGRGELAYFTDFGANRMVQVNGDRVRDFAIASNVDLAVSQDVALFSWGVAVDDYNRDGLDDLLVGQGAVKAMPAFEYAIHFPAYLQQNGRGTFALHSDDVGLQPYAPEDSGVEEYPYSGRALLRTDLDQDGFIDTIELGLEGRPRLHREVPLVGAAPRCNLIPKARYVPGFGVGHAFRPSADTPWRKWDSQGQLKSGTTPFLLSPWQQGTLRFPSGATVNYDCQGQAGPVVIEESEWLSQTLEGNELTVILGVDAPQGSLSVFVEPSSELLQSEDRGNRRSHVQIPAQTERYMLRFGNRWLARWWTP